MRWHRAAVGAIVAAFWFGTSHAAGDRIPQRYLGVWALAVSASCDAASDQFGGFRITPTQITMKQPAIQVEDRSLPAVRMEQRVVAVTSLPKGIEVIFTLPDKPGQHRIRFIPGQDANTIEFQFVHSGDYRVGMEPIPLRRCSER